MISFCHSVRLHDCMACEAQHHCLQEVLLGWCAWHLPAPWIELVEQRKKTDPKRRKHEIVKWENMRKWKRENASREYFVRLPCSSIMFHQPFSLRGTFQTCVLEQCHDVHMFTHFYSMIYALKPLLLTHLRQYNARAWSSVAIRSKKFQQYPAWDWHLTTAFSIPFFSACVLTKSQPIPV